MRCRFNPQSACQNVSEACRRCVSCRYMQFFRCNIAAIGKNHAARHLQEMEMSWQKNVIGILLFPIAEVLKAESHLKRPHKWIKQLTLIENAMNYMAKIGKILLVSSLIFACGCGTATGRHWHRHRHHPRVCVATVAVKPAAACVANGIGKGERLAMAVAWLENNRYLTATRYSKMTGLLKPAAEAELDAFACDKGCPIVSVRKGKQRGDAATDEGQVIQNRFDRSQKLLDIRKKYYDEYSKFLTQKQIERVYELEKQMMKRLSDRHDRGRRGRK